MGQKVLVRKRDDLMHLLARHEVMMKMKPWGVKNTHEYSSVNSFAPCSEDSNDLSFSVALATFLTQSCPVVPRDAVTTSMYLVKSSLAKTGALEATAPVND